MEPPPLPPNCPWFKLDGETWFFTLPWVPLQIYVFIPEWRPIISAVAADYWIREVDRLFLLDSQSVQVKPDSLIEAKENADLWRMWGRE